MELVLSFWPNLIELGAESLPEGCLVSVEDTAWYLLLYIDNADTIKYSTPSITLETLSGHSSHRIYALTAASLLLRTHAHSASIKTNVSASQPVKR